tara:strand:- start:2539 stop:3420 length:882 start_codon:yes stop_codon:yes gene_type:complete
MKIGLFVDGIWGLQTLNLLLKKNYKISFIVLRYLKRNNEFEIRKIATKNSIKIYIFKNINNISSLKKIKKHDFNLFISVSYNQILKKHIYNLPYFKSINCHASLLPKYRGRNVINWALINGEKNFGITIHYINEGIDTGDIIYQKKIKINNNDDYKSLLKKANLQCSECVIESLNRLRKPRFKAIKQSTFGRGFYCRGRGKGDEIIDWNSSSIEIHNFIRALSIPSLYARSKYKNVNIRFIKSRLIKYRKNVKFVNGQILSVKKFLIIKTKDGAIKITKYNAFRKLKVENILV